MARLVLIHGRDPLVRQLAEDIIASQTVEIAGNARENGGASGRPESSTERLSRARLGPRWLMICTRQMRVGVPSGHQVCCQQRNFSGPAGKSRERGDTFSTHL